MPGVLQLKIRSIGATIHRVVHKCATVRPLRPPNKRVTEATARNNGKL